MNFLCTALSESEFIISLMKLTVHVRVYLFLIGFKIRIDQFDLGFRNVCVGKDKLLPVTWRRNEQNPQVGEKLLLFTSNLIKM